MPLLRPRRSALYMPGSNARAIEKARSLAADVLILDLEDAVAPEAKAVARRQVCDAVSNRTFGSREVVVRINALSTPWGRDDLEAVAVAKPDAVLLPKVDRAGDVIHVQAALDASACPATVGLWAMMETPRAVLDALAIAEAALGPAPRLGAFVVGTNDLLKDTRMRAAPRRTPLVPWLATLVAAARACGLAILDGVYNLLDDGDGLSIECAQARELGMDGKTLIHPRQIEPCNAAFAPSAAELAWARKVVAAFDDNPANAARNVVQVDGQMVERLHLAAARHDLATAEIER
jgi:citrate lyase subunit beta / citryl-CoA lyase